MMASCGAVTRSENQKEATQASFEIIKYLVGIESKFVVIGPNGNDGAWKVEGGGFAWLVLILVAYELDLTQPTEECKRIHPIIEPTRAKTHDKSSEARAH